MGPLGGPQKGPWGPPRGPQKDPVGPLGGPPKSPRAFRGLFDLFVFIRVFRAAGYLLQQKSIQTIGASTSAAFLNGISPITILSAAVILGEQVTLAQVACIGVVFFGLFLNARNMTLVHLPPK